MDKYELKELFKEARKTNDATDLLEAILYSNFDFNIPLIHRIVQDLEEHKVEQHFLTPWLANDSIEKFVSETTLSVNHRLSNGETLLTQSILTRNYKVVVILIERGADIKLENSDGETPLEVAEYSLENINIRDISDSRKLLKRTKKIEALIRQKSLS